MDYLISNIWQYIKVVFWGTGEYRTLCIFVGLIVLLVFIIPGRTVLQHILISCFLIYIFFVFSSTVLIRAGDVVEPLKYVMPFTEYKAAFLMGGFKYDIVENILLFFPAGVLMGIISDIKRWWLPILYLSFFSLCIEVLQCFLKIGYIEFDDWFNNTMGAAIGCGLSALLRKAKR